MNGLYFDKNPFLYTRSFMKLQDLAPVVGGALKSKILVFAIMGKYVNSIGVTTHFGNIFFFTKRKFEKEMEKFYQNQKEEMIDKNKQKKLGNFTN
jgi:hypothetical protein